MAKNLSLLAPGEQHTYHWGELFYDRNFGPIRHEVAEIADDAWKAVCLGLGVTVTRDTEHPKVKEYIFIRYKTLLHHIRPVYPPLRLRKKGSYTPTPMPDYFATPTGKRYLGKPGI